MESLVGHPFLPKGVGLVTRSPIVIQIINISDSEAEYGKKSYQIEEQEI